MIENMKVRRFKEEDAQEVRNLIVRNFLEVNSKDYGISAMEKLAKAYNAEKVLNVATDGWKVQTIGTFVLAMVVKETIVGTTCIL